VLWKNGREKKEKGKERKEKRGKKSDFEILRLEKK
jgi:hypothetical protein